MKPAPPLVIGLLGGVAAGKSAVAEALGRHGLRVIDADAKARALERDPEIRRRLAERFGPDVVTAGGLDRRRLAGLVFSDPQAREDLEAILHPPIRAGILADLDAALAAGTSVVLDAPLLLEGGLIARCDVCVFVHASEATRRARARARGWDEKELRRREEAQAPLSVKKSHCAFTIDNDGPLTDAAGEVATLLRRIADRHASPG